MKSGVWNYVSRYILLGGILKKLRIVVWSMESYRLNILFQNSFSILKWSQMAVKETMIKHICGKTASQMMDYWGLEIDRDSWICGVKRSSHIFLHTGIEVLNLNYKILLTKSSAHTPWTLREKSRATTTSSPRPHAVFPWERTVGRVMPLPF